MFTSCWTTPDTRPFTAVSMVGMAVASCCDTCGSVAVNDAIAPVTNPVMLPRSVENVLARLLRSPPAPTNTVDATAPNAAIATSTAEIMTEAFANPPKTPSIFPTELVNMLPTLGICTPSSPNADDSAFIIGDFDAMLPIADATPLSGPRFTEGRLIEGIFALTPDSAVDNWPLSSFPCRLASWESVWKKLPNVCETPLSPEPIFSVST